MQIFDNGNLVPLSDDQKADFAPLQDPLAVLEWYVGDSDENSGYEKSSVLFNKFIIFYKIISFTK